MRQIRIEYQVKNKGFDKSESVTKNSQLEQARALKRELHRPIFATVKEVEDSHVISISRIRLCTLFQRFAGS
jgi:hypothetical protein